MTEAAAGPAQKLARMAGQIADFFKAYPEAEAVPAIADHINQFWSRRMRQDLVNTFGPGDAALDPLVSKALPRIRLG